MKILFGIVLLFGVVAALDQLASGDGICSVCSQVAGKSNCCSGNARCISIDGLIECDHAKSERDHFELATEEFSRSLYDRASDDFCSICCGLDSTSQRCCSGIRYCRCTKTLAPSCLD
ncbi:uncharacterized protein LOC143464918 [Clavelina lepadiformis]|uniref:uncharacterized protein LOC143464918 n=1 Tax=Clavelina lepadiformis TaxID=159417 RepID=UPI004041BD3A